MLVLLKIYIFLVSVDFIAFNFIVLILTIIIKYTCYATAELVFLKPKTLIK